MSADATDDVAGNDSGGPPEDVAPASPTRAAVARCAAALAGCWRRGRWLARTAAAWALAVVVGLWRRARRRVHPVRGLATVAGWFGWAAIRGAWPVVMAFVQAQAWCLRWHRLTNRLATGGARSAVHLVIVGVVLWYLPDAGILTWLLVAPSGLVLGFTAGRALYKRTPRGRARGRYSPDRGWATLFDLRESVAAHAVRVSAAGTDDPSRPSLQRQVLGKHSARPSARRIAALDATECGTPLGKSCIGTPWPTRCYASWRDTVALVGATGVGKSDVQCHQVIDAPGAVVVTQTKPGTYLRTAPLRAQGGRPVLLVDPDGLTGHRSTLGWSPVVGCLDPDTAMRRAGAMVGACGSWGEENEAHAQKAAVVLRALLLTADAAKVDMIVVYAWAAGGVGGLLEAIKVMKAHEDRLPDGWIEAMSGVLNSKADKLRDGILAMVASAVEFMADPHTAALCVPGPDQAPFDVEAFILSRGTLYLIAAERAHSSAAPYLAALADHVFEQAKIVAGRGRLDPPLQVNADEAANTIVLPLDRWLTDSAGRGIQIVFSVQSRSQLVARWGDAGARTIWNGSTIKMIAGGLTDDQDLRAISELCGQYLVLDEDTGRAEWRPTLSQNDIRRIPRWTWLLLHRSTPITFVTASRVGRRADVLAARFTEPAPQPTAPPQLISVGVSGTEVVAYVPEQWTAEHAEEVSQP